MNKEQLAKWLHDNYEEVAKEKDWNTQQNCKVEFDTLPDANKQTMIEIAQRLLDFKLLRLYIVTRSNLALLWWGWCTVWGIIGFIIGCIKLWELIQRL